MCWNAFERLSIFGPPSHVLLPPAEAEKHKMSGENRAGLCHPYILTHTHTYATTHLLTGLLTVRLLSQCPRRGRCPFIWTKPERGDSLDLISKLLHQFISIHTTEQPRALPPTPHQQLSSSFRNLCPNAASGKKKKKKKKPDRITVTGPFCFHTEKFLSYYDRCLYFFPPFSLVPSLCISVKTGSIQRFTCHARDAPYERQTYSSSHSWFCTKYNNL